MSRSYRNRKNNGIAIVRDYMKSSGHGKKYKRISNKKMRKMNITNGNMYKKNGLAWDIHEYRIVEKIPKDWHKHLGSNEMVFKLKYYMCK